VPLLGLGLAVLVGLALGLLGAGGSALTVPIFVYAFDFDPKQAVPMSLLVVGTTSIVGALARIGGGAQVRLRSAMVFGPVAMAGAYLGARLGVLVSGATQLSVLGVAMLAAAISMVRTSGWTRSVAAPPPRPRTALVVAAAGGVGMLTGFAGVGGGFLFVPALTLFAGLPIHQAIGTSLVVITLNSATALAGYAGHVGLPWPFLTMFTVLSVAGVVIGTRWVRYVSQPILRRALAAVLAATSLFMLYQNRSVFAAAGEPGTALVGARAIGN
jgi:uncharacterized membrane protein YfcA